MMRRLLHRPALLALLCLALLVVRGGGAHLHLCFDGSEPPASLHFEDSGHFDAHHVSEQGHQDVDLSLNEHALTKVGKIGVDLSVMLLLALFVLLLLPVASVASSAAPVRALPARPPRLRPPLRGPPFSIL